MAVLNDLIVTGSARIIGPISGTFPAGEVLVGNGTGAIMTKPILTEFNSQSPNLVTAQAISTYVFNKYLRLEGGTLTNDTVSIKDSPGVSLLTLEKTNTKPAAGTILPLVSARYQNQAGNWYGGDIISAIGTKETGEAYNSCIKFGSYNGSTFITAGEAGSKLTPLIVQQEGTQIEKLYMLSDGAIEFHVGNVDDGFPASAARTHHLRMTISNTAITHYIPISASAANDYAESREITDSAEPGRVVIENGDDTLSLSTRRLMPGANIISDTYGFVINETDEIKTPIAVSGRVLAYTYEDRNTFKAGDPVCSGPNGTVSKMTREEVKEYPDRMIGTVSAIPDYETWGSNNIKVNGRIWIKVL